MPLSTIRPGYVALGRRHASLILPDSLYGLRAAQ